MSNRPRVSKAVIPAAGFGTRMLPATKAIPKEMLPVAGKPLIQYAVEEAAAAGVQTIVIVIRDHKSLIEAHFARDPSLEDLLKTRQISSGLLPRVADSIELRYVEQEQPLGLAHAISCAKPLLGGEPFVVLLPDVIMVSDEPVTRQLICAHDAQGGSVVAVREVEPHEVQRHGIVRPKDGAAENGRPLRLAGLVEKPAVADAPSRLGVFGRYLLQPEIWEAIASTRPDSRGEIQLTDALNLLSQGSLVSGLCFRGRHYDAGDRLGYLKANIELSLLDPRLCPQLREYLSHLPV